MGVEKMYDKKNVIHIDLSDTINVASDVEQMAGRSFIPTIESKEAIADKSVEEQAAIFSKEKDLFNLESLTEKDKIRNMDPRLMEDVEKMNTHAAIEMQKIKKKTELRSDDSRRIDRVRKRLKSKKLRSVNDERRPGDNAERSRKEEEEYAAYMRVKGWAKEYGSIGRLMSSITEQVNRERDERCGPFKRCEWDINDVAFLERDDFNELGDEEKRDMIGDGDYVVGEIKNPEYTDFWRNTELMSEDAAEWFDNDKLKHVTHGSDKDSFKKSYEDNYKVEGVKMHRLDNPKILRAGFVIENRDGIKEWHTVRLAAWSNGKTNTFMKEMTGEKK
jgi:hypothetical protein